MNVKAENIHFRNQIIFWVLSLLTLMVVVWMFKSILLPFILGFAVAYLLNPIVTKLENRGFNRKIGTIMILSVFMLFLAVFFATVTPILYRELGQLSQDLPQWIDKLEAFISPHLDRIQVLLGQENESFFDLLKDNASASAGAGKTLLEGLKAGGAFVSSFITILVVTPFVSFFMMLEWSRFTNWVNGLIPRHHQDTVLDLLGQMDKKLAGFVRGQISIAAFLAILYALSLTVLGLKYGFLIGIFAGFFNIIPLVGSTLGLLIGVLVAWLQAGDLTFIALVAGVFIVGQLIEGNILTPKILGDSVGLHPLWIFFALMAGGGLFGIVGMLIAIPVASVLSVICAFLITQYKASPYYLGIEKKAVAKSSKKKKAPQTKSKVKNAKP